MAVELLSGLPVTVEHEPPARSWGSTLELGRKLGLSSYDASYLDLAMRTGLPLATRDDQVREACAAVGLPLFGVEAG